MRWANTQSVNTLCVDVQWLTAAMGGVGEQHLVWPLAFKALKPDGRMYHEDFFMKKPFTAEEEHLLGIAGPPLSCAGPLGWV